MTLNYPENLSFTITGANSWTPATTYSQGIPVRSVPDISKGTIPLLPGYAINTLPQHPKRDYVQTWNFFLRSNWVWASSERPGTWPIAALISPARSISTPAQVLGAGTAGQL